MITRNNLPENYQPFDTLIICSNTLKGGGHLVAVGDTLPLVIGKGEKLKVWLQALANAQKNEFVLIVEESISKHPAVKVYEEAGVLNVMISGEIILSVEEKSSDSAVISKLDFRPIGLNLFGDANSLNAGGGIFSGNTMSGGGTLIGFGATSSNK